HRDHRLEESGDVLRTKRAARGRRHRGAAGDRSDPALGGELGAARADTGGGGRKRHLMHPTVVLNVVGLTPRLLADATPYLAALVRAGGMRPLETILPAVTCAVQSTFTTGTLPRDHGCVANGWYFRDLSEIWLWRQSNRLVAGEKIWEAAARRDPA